MIDKSPDIQLVLTTYLRANIEATVSTDRPADQPVPYVQVTKISGYRKDILLSHPIVDIDVFAATLEEANSLSLDIEWLLLFDIKNQDLPDAVVTGATEERSPSEVPYDDTSKRRVSATYLIHCRAI